MALALAMTDARYSLYERREIAEHAVDDLIAFLDDLDGDPDLEPYLAGIDYSTDDREGDLDQDEGDELEAAPGVGRFGESDGDCDREEDDPGEDNGDREPSIGGVAQYVNGRLEYDLEGDQAADCEPSLGRPDHILDQSKPVGFSYDDAEEVDEDGGDINDEPHDDNELDGGTDGMPDWPCPATEMTEGQKAEAASEANRLLRQARRLARA